MLNLNILAFQVPAIEMVIRADGHGQFDSALIPIKKMYTSYGPSSFSKIRRMVRNNFALSSNEIIKLLRIT